MGSVEGAQMVTDSMKPLMFASNAKVLVRPGIREIFFATFFPSQTRRSSEYAKKWSSTTLMPRNRLFSATSATPSTFRSTKFESTPGPQPKYTTTSSTGTTSSKKKPSFSETLGLGRPISAKKKTTK